MGAMALWRLSQRGVPAIGIEQFGIAHDRGSSHGGSRIFRRLVFEGDAYLPVVDRAYDLWRELERQRGRVLLTTTGGINIGTIGGDLLRDAERVAAAGGLDVEVLDAHAIRRRFPQHDVFDDDAAVYEPGAGVLLPEAAIVEAIAAAKSNGADVLTDTVVDAIRTEGDEVTIETAAATIVARRVIVATGAWFTDLIGEVVIPVRVQRSILHWFASDHPRDFGPDRFPVFIRESRHLNGWGIPDIDGRGTKVGISGHAKSWLRRPEDNWSPPTPVDTAPVVAFTREALPGLDAHPSSAVPCMNAKTPDGDFIIGESSHAPGLILLGGFSGHGFKHATAIGDIAAALATDGACDIPIEGFAPDRFGSDPWPTAALPVHDPAAFNQRAGA